MGAGSYDLEESPSESEDIDSKEFEMQVQESPTRR